MLTSKEVIINDWQITLNFFKDNNKSLVIFLHGASYPANCMMLINVDGQRGVDKFNETGLDTLFFNFPGFADALPVGPIDENFNNDSAVEIVNAVFNEVESEYENIFICGLSHGGLIAFLFAQKYSHPKLKGLIQFEPRVGQGTQFINLDLSKFHRIIHDRNEIITLWEQSRIKADMQPIPEVQNGFTSIGEELEQDPELKQRKSMKVGMWATQMSPCNYDAVKIPTLWIYTQAQEWIFKPEHHLRLSEVLLTHPNFQLHFIPKATHWFFAEPISRDLATNRIKKFVEEIVVQ